MQETTGFKANKYDAEEVEYDLTEELNTYMRAISKIMKNIHFVNKDGFPKLLTKYLTIMKNEDSQIEPK
jgi:hypothetical protein